jgi:hypothetical protein
MLLLPLRLPSLSSHFSFSSFPKTLLLPLILLSQFHMRLLLALHIRSLFIVYFEYFLTLDVTVPLPIQKYFVHRFTNPFGKSVILHKHTATLICWKILQNKQLSRCISRTNLLTSCLTAFIKRSASQRVTIVKDFCLDTPRHLRH